MAGANNQQGTQDMVINMLREQVRETKAAVDWVRDGLAEHINSCARLQKVQIIIGCALALLVEGHSPEAGKFFAKLAELLF